LELANPYSHDKSRKYLSQSKPLIIVEFNFYIGLYASEVDILN